MIGTCECCGYEEIEVKPYTSLREADIRQRREPSTANLCIICASTYIGTMWGFPSQHDTGVLQLAQALGWTTNHILREVKK